MLGIDEASEGLGKPTQVAAMVRAYEIFPNLSQDTVVVGAAEIAENVEEGVPAEEDTEAFHEGEALMEGGDEDDEWEEWLDWEKCE